MAREGRSDRGDTPRHFFFSAPQHHPWVTLQGAPFLRSGVRNVLTMQGICPFFTSLGEGRGSPPLWADTSFTIKTELPGFSKGSHIINS